MVVCELCGTETDVGKKVSVSSAMLLACSSCFEEFGDQRNEEVNDKQEKDNEDADQLVQDYGKEVNKAREKAGLSIDELSEITDIDTVVIEEVENEERVPSTHVQMQLEDYLGIDLVPEDGEQWRNVQQESIESKLDYHLD